MDELKNATKTVKSGKFKKFGIIGLVVAIVIIIVVIILAILLLGVLYNVFSNTFDLGALGQWLKDIINGFIPGFVK